ncbi:class I SAM-dependent methyltransferase [Nonomuraea jiangxiensis]|uniref:Methyltransferase domain-containing protein n=1 Tax=Nonomuraea jiangxiensis TaxID=633440 RepID=A0A1G9U9N5_9ACTN|nr:class I SAM-dependent methyltransferase [Nonomuraea jiangxiensis]SDM56265.1 Methyltransferase domain-containing protein [Nonomuraea jiangxiensis]
MADASFIAATRDSYDALASGYLDRFDPARDPRKRPLDRALFAAFAELVRAGGNGPVADVGCGTGWLTDVLHRLGLDAFGIDLSPGMVAQARLAYPELRFEVGSMLALDLADGVLGGLVASYSIIHVPWELRPEVFAEFHRVLAPGGQVMLGFQVGDEHRHRDEAWGTPVCLDWYRQRPDEVAELLRGAGFELTGMIVRAPEAGEQTPHGHVLAAKPSAGPGAGGRGMTGPVLSC